MQNRKTKSKGRPILIALLALVAVVAAGAFYVFGEIGGTFRGGETLTVEIPQGATTTDIASILSKAGAIGNPTLFRLYSRYVGADGSYQYGTFQLRPREGYEGVTHLLQSQPFLRDSVVVTFPEGYNAYQMGQVLETAGLVTAEEFVDAVNTHSYDFDFLSNLSDNPLKLVRYEGFLFPDTYEFHEDADVDTIVSTLLQNFQRRVLDDAFEAELAASGMTLEELITFASIIQKEAANVEEMYNVSSVFWNRMNNTAEYPRLESCTTNDYINDYMRPAFGGNAPSDMLEAYDTYDKSGLPIAAIANPGLDAIRAALNPNDTPYYFFVTDITKKHYYGRTYADHLSNIDLALEVNLSYGKQGL